MTYDLLRWAVRFLCRVYLGRRFTIAGEERIPGSGGYLVCANHIGTVDPALVPAWINRADSWSMAKAEMLQGGGLSAWVLDAYHAFGVVRHTPDRKSLRRSREVLQGGGVLIIYPEGHRAWDGRLQRAEAGAAFLARATQSPILPVAVVGTNQVMPRGAWFPRRRPVSLRVGALFRLADRNPDGTRIPHQEAADAIMMRIASLLPPEMRGVYAGSIDDPHLEALALPAEPLVAPR